MPQEYEGRVGVMLLQALERQRQPASQPSEVRREYEPGSSYSPQKETSLADTLISYFQPPKLREFL